MVISDSTDKIEQKRAEKRMKIGSYKNPQSLAPHLSQVMRMSLL
jgi:hypothetical protein